jgi:hypothetical protein
MDREYRTSIRGGSRVSEFAYRARTGQVNARVLAYAGFKPAQNYLGWPPHEDPFVKRASNGKILPGVVPFEIFLDNLKKLGHKEDYSSILTDFDEEVKLIMQEPDWDRDIFLEVENNYKQMICEKVVATYNVDSNV